MKKSLIISSLLFLGSICLTSCNFSSSTNAKQEISVYFTNTPLNNEISVGENFTLGASVLNSSNTNVYFESLNPEIASVSRDGILKGVSVGTTTIYAVSEEDETKNISLTIVVKEKVLGSDIIISLNKTTLDLVEGDNFLLKATVTNFDNNDEVTFQSANSNIATIDENGLVTAISEGTTIVTVTSVENSNKKVQCAVNVTKASSSDIKVTIKNPAKTSLNINETITLTASVTNTTNQKVIWSSSNSNLISVDSNGICTGVSQGEVIISATSEEDETKSNSISLRCIENIHGYELIWADNFDGDSLNLNNWEYQEGDGSAYDIPGWGNNEAQYYTRNNVTVSDGTLKITLKAENMNGKEYTSSRIRTYHKVAHTYGRIEAKIKVDAISGVWPAFWMLPDTTDYGGWPNSGEIDIMELRGRIPTQTTGALHFALQNGTHQYVTDYETYANNSTMNDYHIYAVEWDEHELRWYVDDINFLTVNNWSISGQGSSNTAPFDKDFHILLNFACGGTFDNYTYPDKSQLPAVMEVDYVKWYQ